jgi:tight adherence protein C
MATGALVTTFWFLLLTFGFITTLYFAWDRGRRPLHRRLDDLSVKFRMNEGSVDDRPLPDRGFSAAMLDWTQRRVPAPNLEKPAVEKMVNALQYAGFYSPAAPKVFIFVRIVSTVGAAWAGLLVGALIGRPPLLCAIIFAGMGYSAPIFYVRKLANSRQIKIRRELPDVIDLLVVCAECGLGLLAAIRTVGRECQRQGRIMGGELGMLSSEITGGATFGDGLRAVAQRTGVDDIKTIAAILIQGEKLGTEMAQALRATSDQLRLKRSMRAEEMAQKLPIKMVFPMVFFLLPAIMLILTGPAMIQILRAFTFR